MKSIAVVILNYKGWHDSLNCLESLLSQDHENFRIILIDNYSENESVQKFKEYLNGDLKLKSEYFIHENKKKKRNYIEYTHEEQINKDNLSEKELSDKDIVLISTSKNLGFSGGNNVGARYASLMGYEYVLLLNNDTLVTDKSFLNKLIEPFKKDNTVYMSGPNIINFDDTFDSPMIEDTFMGNLFYLSLLNFFRRKLNTPSIYKDIEALSSHIPKQVYKISGACMMLDTKKFEGIEYLDEKVWLSSEEAILSEKIKAKGGKIMFTPLTTLIHKKAASPRPKSDKVSILRNHYKQREYFYKTYKKYGPLKMNIIRLMVSIRILITKIKG